MSLGGASVTTTGAITTSGGAGNGADLAGGDAGSITVVADSGAIVLSASVLTAAGGAASAAGNADGGSGGAVRLDAGTGSTIGIRNVTTSGGNRVGTGSAGAGGDMTFADAVLLQANAVLAADGGSAGLGAGGDVQFASTVDSSGTDRTLAVNTGGTTTFGGAVGGIAPLASLTTNAAGSTLINGGGVTTTGDQIYNDPVTITGPTTLAASAGAITATGVVTAGGALTLVADAGRDISLANAANDFGTVAIASARNATLVDANDLTLGTSTLSGRLTARAGGTIQLAGNLTAGGTGDSIVLAASGSFDNAGGFALDAGAGRWLVYSIDPSANAFGGLASGNQALWNRFYPAVVPEAGNRYVFSTQPTLTFTSTDVAKTYGQDATAAVAGAYAVTGFVDASAYGGVFSQDTAANTFSGAPAVTSPGAPGTASVAGSPYPIDVDVTGVTPTTGYGKAAVSTGVLRVNAAPLTITADNQWKVYGAADPVLTATFTGLQNGETPSVVTGLSLFAPTGAAATVTGSPHPIAAFGASAANYTISYVDGLLTVAPRPISITADAQTKVYSQPDPALTYAVGGSGLAYGDVLAGELARVAGENVATGPYRDPAGHAHQRSQSELRHRLHRERPLDHARDVDLSRRSRLDSAGIEVSHLHRLRGGIQGQRHAVERDDRHPRLQHGGPQLDHAWRLSDLWFGTQRDFGNYVFVQAPTNATALTIRPGGVPNPAGVPPDAYAGALASAAQSESACAELQVGSQSETLCGAQQNFRPSQQVNLVPGWRRVIELGRASLTLEGEGIRLPQEHPRALSRVPDTLPWPPDCLPPRIRVGSARPG